MVALIFCIRATSLSRTSNNGVQGSWQTRSLFNSTFEWNAKSGSSVAVPEVVALDSDTYMAPGFLDSNALSPGLMMMNLFRFPGPIVIPRSGPGWAKHVMMGELVFNTVQISRRVDT